MTDQLRKSALDYHRFPQPGKLSIAPTKALTSQHDLALAYSPGVAYACAAIAEDPLEAAHLTSRSNLVAVVTNGSAVLGLGNIGPLAAKPVMEGKACLFKRFAGIDVFDIEVSEHDPERLADIVAALEPTFGGINLEDIKAPECFTVERRLREKVKIPVFHDDQHGTAIIAGAAILNALSIVGKDIAAAKLAVSGAGAAAIACLDLLVELGIQKDNIHVCDSRGVIYFGRDSSTEPNKARYARDTRARTLADAVAGADLFLGVSVGGVLTKEMVRAMADRPIILALANPDPEIRPEDAKAARPDCIVATGRSDYPNQVNNVLCFPFVFRGALDVGASAITEPMKLAALKAIAALARAEQSDIATRAYGGEPQRFGPDYIIPRPFDPRLILRVAPAVARAAMDSGVATRPITDLDAYQQSLARFVFHSGVVMRPVFGAARHRPARIAYAEGEDERVLHAAQIAIEERLAKPVLVGRDAVIEARIKHLGLGIRAGSDFEVVSRPETDPHASPTRVGAALLERGEVDALLCGTAGGYREHLAIVAQLIGPEPQAALFAAMNMLLLPKHTLFICDTYVHHDPSAEEIARIAVLAAQKVLRFGIRPKAALLSHSNSGDDPSASAAKMAWACKLIERLAPDLQVAGEMHGDAALESEANLLVMPNLDAASIAFNLLKITGGEGVTVGPILLGASKPAHILTPTASVRRIVNMTAFASVDAQPSMSKKRS